MMQQMFLGLGAASQTYWIITLGGSSAEAGNGVTHDSSGNVYVTGTTESDGPGGNDLLVAKYDKDGVIQWQRALGGSTAYRNDDVGTMIKVDSSGNIYVVGITNSTAGYDSMMIAKYNSSGSIQWQRTLGTSSTQERGRGISVDSSGNVFVCGETTKGMTSIGAIVAKYNSSGTLQWQRTLDDSSSQEAYDVAIDSSDNIYIGGETAISGRTYYFVSKYNNSGAIQWQRTFGSSNISSNGRSVTVDSSDNVYVAGQTTGGGIGVYDSVVVKYNSSGTYQWQRAIGTSGQQIAIRGMTFDSSDNIYIAGSNSSKYFFAKYNSSGTLQWQRSLGGSASDSATSISADDKGNVYVMGSSSSSGAGGSDMMFAKIPSDGSMTGTYGSFTYAATTHTSATPSLTSATSSHTDAAGTCTSSTSSFTDEAVTLTSTKTDVE
jgi:uncharacterized delta-60 repeat protein